MVISITICNLRAAYLEIYLLRLIVGFPPFCFAGSILTCVTFLSNSPHHYFDHTSVGQRQEATGSKEKGSIAPFDGSAGLQMVRLLIELQCLKVNFVCQKNWYFRFP